MKDNAISLGLNRLDPNDPRQDPGTNQPSKPAADTTAEESSKPVKEISLTEAEKQEVMQAIVAKLHTCFDPEIPVNIYELGLIYDIDLNTNGHVHINMTLTSPACPVAGSLPGDVKNKVLQVENVASAKVELVWDPPWEKSRMSEAAKLQLGIDD